MNRNRRHRRNPSKRPPTASEQRKYATGWDRTFKKKRKKSAAKKGGSAASKRALKREHVYRAAVKSGVPAQKAARKAMRTVPYEKGAKGRTYKGVKVYTGKGTKRRAKAKKRAKLPAQYRSVRTTRRVKKRVTVSVKRKTRVAYGRYKRSSVTDPRTGKKKLSYYYRAKGKKGRKKIPSWAIAGAKSPRDYKNSKYDKERERIRKRRAAAARRVERGGNAFVPNRSKRKMRKNKSRGKGRSTKRSRAAKKGWRSRKARAAARRPARRKRRTKAGKARRRTRRYKANRAAAPKRRRRARRTVGKGRGKLGVRLKRGKVYYKGRKPRSLRGRKRGVRKLPKGRIYLTNRRKRPKSMVANRRRRATGEYFTNRRRRSRKGGRRRVARGRRYTSNRRRRGYRRNGSRRYTRNAWMADMKVLLKGALFGTAGFIGHKVITRLLVDKVVVPMLTKSSAATPPPASGFGATDIKAELVKWAPLLVGLPVAGALIFATGKAAPKAKMQVGAGVIISIVHTGILALLGLSTSKGATDAAKMIAGYDSSSTAAAIGRYRRNRGGMRGLRGLRGLGGGGAPQQSIMPRYAPTGLPGGIQQAVAGRLPGRRGTGEYFQTSGMGEYFASGVQGIGAYEMAGPLVTQAAAGFGQTVDDGIRPDCDLDQLLTLAEAQAGTGGMGEYYSAQRSGQQFTVPQRSEWIPGDSDPQLWAGTKSANDPADVSEIPAGILETSGGNGIFG